ncbi:MAG TPA: response regulator transcription factor [Chloroflexota bacterium]|nr:response regulator transcription factor [Chloroflexota bacterium]
MTVLVVDDEAIVTEVIERYLRREGYPVYLAADGQRGLDLARSLAPDLIVLDLMLPKVGGLEVCQTPRAESSVPIILLTAKGEETDKILGLGLGADDYVVKPFSPGELVARIKAVLRRMKATPTADAGSLRFGSLRILPRRRVVEIAGSAVALTAKEFDLLHFLARYPGQVFTREQLLDQVWDYEYVGDASTVTVHIRRLREKVEADPVRPRWIKTVWGVGYKLHHLETVSQQVFGCPSGHSNTCCETVFYSHSMPGSSHAGVAP